MEKTIEYDKNGEVIVIWKPERCIHSGVCVKTLPQVYHPKEKPWVTPEQARGHELIDQIDRCPSKALTYRINQNRHGNSQG